MIFYLRLSLKNKNYCVMNFQNFSRENNRINISSSKAFKNVIYNMFGYMS